MQRTRNLRRVLGLLMAICLLTGLLPVTAMAAQTASPPRDVTLESLGDGKIKATWNNPEKITSIPIYEFEAELFYKGNSVGKQTIENIPFATFTDLASNDVDDYGVKVRARQATDGIGDPDNLISFHVTDWTDWSSKATAGMLDPGGSTPPEPEEVQKIEAIYLEGETWTVTPSQAPTFTTKVADSDKDKYEIMLEKWEEATSSGKPKYITSDETANAEIPENQRLMEFEYDKQYYYSVSIEAKEGYALDLDTWSKIYLNGEDKSPQEIEDPVTEGAPEGCYTSCTLKNVFISKAVSFDRISLKGATAFVTPDNMHDVLGDGTVRYDQSSKTLTLENANFTTAGDGIISQVPGLTLHLIGNNAIKAMENFPNVFSGIGAQADLKIAGSGSLTISGFPYGVHSDEGVQVAIEDGVTLILQSAPAGDNQDPVAMNVKPDLSNYPNAHIMAGSTVEDTAEVTNPDGTDYHTSKYLSISPRQAEPEPEELSIADSFPDEGFRTYISAKFDTNKDGNLSETEIAAATSIGGLKDIAEQNNIKSLEGIGHFTALTTLDASRMALEPAPLDLSGNKTLASVLLNTQKLESLNVSGLTNLQSLALANCGLTELDLSSNTALNHLVISGNQLTSLDVSKTNLDVSKTNLSSELKTIENSVFTGNSYEITLTGNTFNLSMLPGGFDTNKASGWNGGNVTDTTLTVNSGAVEVTYTYDCGNGIKTEFKLKVSNSPTDTHQWAIVWRWDEGNHWRDCLEEGCSEQTDKATHSMDSDGSCTVCGYDPKYPELSVPTNLRWDGTVARWDPVEGITNYRVTLYQNGKIMWNQDIRTTEKDFSGWLKDPGEFYFTVAPMKAGLNYSFPSPVPHWAAQSPAYTVEGSEELNPSNPTVIERIELDMDAPAAGQPLGRPRTAEGALYQVDGFSWQLCAGPGGSGIEYLFSGEDNFENGKCYRLYIGLQAEFNCVISENATATFDGLSPNRIEIETSEHGNISSIVAWFTVGTPTVPTEISELTFSDIPEPTSGINFTEAQEAAQTHINDSVAGIYQARVSYYKWDGEKDWDGQYSSDAYDENGHYALGLELKAADGYKFGKNITVTVNGKTARIISQSDYSIEVFMLFDSNPADPLVIKDVAIMSDVWPHDKDEINIKDNNFYINDAYYIFYHMVMFTIEEAELKVSEDKGETWRSLTDADTHFDADLQYGFFITVKALDGAKFDANMEGWIRGSADVTVSEDGKTAYLSRDNLRVYKEAGVYLKHKGEYVWDYDSVPVAINKPEAGAPTSVPEGAAAALLMTGSLGVKASGVWYEVPYVGSTYALKSKPTTFEAGKTYMLAVELTCDSGGEYSFGDTFEVERFVEYSNVDNNIDYARKETVPTNDPHFSQKYNYWFTVGAYSEPEKITSINITGPEVLRDALGDETIFSFSEEQLAQFKVDGDITVKDIWWSGSGRLYLDLAVPSGHYFEIPSKLSVKYNDSDAQIYTVGFGVLHSYDLLSVTIMDVPSAAATVTQGGVVTEYETLESAVAALGENEGVITLLRSAEVVGTDDSSILSIPGTAELKISENATLTVPEGKTLQLANPAFLNSPGSIAVEAGGTLNIPDSTGSSTAFVGADDSARIKLTAGQMTFQIGKNLLTLAKNAQAEIPKDQEAWLLKSTNGTEKLPLDAVIETGAHLTVNGTLNIISGSNQAGSTLTVKGTLDGTNGNISLAQYGEIVVDQGGVLQTNAASMLRALGTARVMTGGTLTINGAEMIGSNSLNVDGGGVRLQPNDRGGFTCTVETGGKATVKGHWMDGDENGYRIAKSDDFIVDGELVLAYRTELSGSMTVENGGNLLIDENGALYAFSTEGSSPSLTVQEGGNVQVSGKLAVADKNAVVTGTYNLADNGKVYAESEISQHLVNAVVSENKTFENHTYAYAWEAERKTSTPPSLGGSGGVSTYAITVEDSENGEVESSRTRAARGDTVTLTVTPDEGYKLDTLTVTDSKGEELELTNKGGGKYTFEMPSGKVTVEAEFVQEEAAELPFTDVPENAWYYDAVAYAYENGWMNGTTSTTFAPGLTTSRAMIVTILHRIEGKPSIQESTAFLDVPLDAWYADAVAWAAEHWIVEGYSDTAFGPNDPITREQLAAILYRYAQYKGYDVSAKADLSKFTDVDEISGYALEPLQWANAEGLINGKGNGVLDPKGQATRAEAAAILMRFNEDVAK